MRLQEVYICIMDYMGDDGDSADRMARNRGGGAHINGGVMGSPYETLEQAKESIINELSQLQL